MLLKPRLFLFFLIAILEIYQGLSLLQTVNNCRNTDLLKPTLQGLVNKTDLKVIMGNTKKAQEEPEASSLDLYSTSSRSSEWLVTYFGRYNV